MGEHLIDGEFQSDKYPTCPRGKVPLSCADPTAQDLLWEYAQRRRAVDGEFSDDLERALALKGFSFSDDLRTRMSELQEMIGLDESDPVGNFGMLCYVRDALSRTRRGDLRSSLHNVECLLTTAIRELHGLMTDVDRERARQMFAAAYSGAESW